MKIINDWFSLLADQFEQPYYQQLKNKLINEYQYMTIYPNYEDIFLALNLTSYADVKVVILGQDPYHQPNQAHGLAFSVKPGIKHPPSLVNIFKEIKTDLGLEGVDFEDLTYLAKQGVLLLNTTLTVRAGQPNSHQGIGWERLTDRIIQLLNEKEQPIVFLLWGNSAQTKLKYLTNKIHCVLLAAHPSPLSAYRGFLGCKHFSIANDFLIKNNMEPIKWIPKHQTLIKEYQN